MFPFLDVPVAPTSDWNNLIVRDIEGGISLLQCQGPVVAKHQRSFIRLGYEKCLLLVFSGAAIKCLFVGLGSG